MPSTPAATYGFLTDVDLTAEVAGVLNKSPADLTADRPGWVTVIHAANVRAWGDIRRLLLARGYSLPQLLGLPPALNAPAPWDDGWAIQRDLGLYYALLDGGGLDEQKDLTPYDRRKELTEFIITAGGLTITIAVDDTGTILHGPLNTDQDTFLLGVEPPGWGCRPADRRDRDRTVW